MAQDKSAGEDGREASGASGANNAGGAGGGRRFRLPKLFADSADVSEADLPADVLARQSGRDIAERAEALGVTLPAPTEPEVIAAANQSFEGSPRARVLRVPAKNEADGASAPPAAPAAPMEAGFSSAELSGADDDLAPAASSAPIAAAALSGSAASGSTTADSSTSGSATSGSTTADSSTSGSATSGLATSGSVEDGAVLRELEQLRGGMEQMSRTLQAMCDQGQAQDKVFNTLHAELQDYKNDFIYEHLKPVVRPLLFLHDSLEQFDSEMAHMERPLADERRRGVSPHLVRENVAFFLEQLVEALRICEVTPMQTPEGAFDAHLHKVVETVPVAADEDNTIQRVVRTGWYLNGHVFRAAEVIVGKKTEDPNAQLWNHGKRS